MRVVIGVDPHKGSHMAVAIDANEQQCASLHVRSGPRQLEQLLGWAAEFGERVWAVESVGGDSPSLPIRDFPQRLQRSPCR